MEGKFRLCTPWVTHYREIEALFRDDPSVRVEYDEASTTVRLYVQGEGKANALTRLLLPEKQFGNVTLKVQVIPANMLEATTVQLFDAAFEGNPALSRIETVSQGLFSDLSYIVFRREVVQFYNDDFGDVNGQKSTLFQEIAKDVFREAPGTFFCTEAKADE